MTVDLSMPLLLQQLSHLQQLSLLLPLVPELFWVRVVLLRGWLRHLFEHKSMNNSTHRRRGIVSENTRNDYQPHAMTIYCCIPAGLRPRWKLPAQHAVPSYLVKECHRVR